MKTSTVVWIIIVLLIIVGAGWYVYGNTSSVPTDATTGQTSTNTTSTSPTNVVVTYGPNGFSPASITIKQGDSVTFTTSGTSTMWVASNPHPVHTAYDGTSAAQHCAPGYAASAPFDQCATGPSFTFTFNKTGIWGYHNHNNHTDTGTVIVQ